MVISNFNYLGIDVYNNESSFSTVANSEIGIHPKNIFNQQQADRYGHIVCPAKISLQERIIKYFKENGIVDTSVFGITGPDVKTHLNIYNNILGQDSVLVLSEYNRAIYYMMMDNCPPNNVYIVNSDFYLAFKIFERELQNTDYKFGVLDLDLCQTSHVLIRNYSLLEKIKLMSASNIVADTFGLTVTHSIRNDRNPEVLDRFLTEGIENDVPGLKIKNIILHGDNGRYGSPRTGQSHMKTTAVIYQKS